MKTDKKVVKDGQSESDVETVVMQHGHEDHYFHCGWCGYVGLESELPPDPGHMCGKDECPECGTEMCITCCYPTREDAEMKRNSVA